MFAKAMYRKLLRTTSPSKQEPNRDPAAAPEHWGPAELCRILMVRMSWLLMHSWKLLTCMQPHHSLQGADQRCSPSRLLAFGCA